MQKLAECWTSAAFLFERVAFRFFFLNSSDLRGAV